MSRDDAQVSNIAKGGYILRDCDGTPDLILIATGSEVGVTVKAAEKLASEGTKVRVVSMPCTNVFDEQDAAYKEAVLPLAVTARVAVEAAHADYWYKYVGIDGRMVCMTSFGESAPGDVLMDYFGFTVENIANTAKELLD